MRLRDPKHEEQLKVFDGLTAAEQLRRTRIQNHKDPDFIESEVLATRIRNRVGEETAGFAATVEELNRRIQVLIGSRLWFFSASNSHVLEDAISYVWLKFFEDASPVSNSEVRFAVFVGDRADDYARHLLTEKNTMPSMDAMAVSDEEGATVSFISTIGDSNAETPEEILIRRQETEAVNKALAMLATIERNVFYYRVEFGYEWLKVAELLGCSIPTARKHLERSLQKLLGALES